MATTIKSECETPSSANKQKKVAYNVEAYLQELLRDRELLANFRCFNHLPHIIDIEICRVRAELLHLHEVFHIDIDDLPQASGPVVTRQRKVFVPIEDYPNYNFIGRLLGPGGTTAKQFEKDFDCKLMIRGKGSLRNKKKEDEKRGQPNWEHLEEELHVLVSVEDAENRVDIRLDRVADWVCEFFQRSAQTPESEDALKKVQLQEVFYRNAAQRKVLSTGPQFHRPTFLSTLLGAPADYSLLSGMHGNFPHEVNRELGDMPHVPRGHHKARHTNYTQYNNNYRGPRQHSAPRNHSDHHGARTSGQQSARQPSHHHNSAQPMQQQQQAALTSLYNNELAASYPQIITAPGTEFLLAGTNALIDYNNALANSLNGTSGPLTGMY